MEVWQVSLFQASHVFHSWTCVYNTTLKQKVGRNGYILVSLIMLMWSGGHSVSVRDERATVNVYVLNSGARFLLVSLNGYNCTKSGILTSNWVFKQ